MGPWIAHPSPGSFGPVIKEIFSIFSSGGHFVQRGRTVCVILVEGIMRYISVKLF